MPAAPATSRKNAIQSPAQKIKDPYERAAAAEVKRDWKTAAECYKQIVDQRVAELSLINSVQEGLSARLEMQGIYDLVGDKLRDTFNAQVVMISQYDPKTNRVFHHYAIERGRHLHIPGWQPIDSSRERIVRTRLPYMINLAEILRLLEAQKMKIIPGTELPKTWLGVPMLVGGEVKGIVSLQNLDKENAFSKSDIDLLVTLTNSMSMSLENARLARQTARLFHLMEQEMEIARHTQQSILPSRNPERPGYDFGSLMIPARAVGGDFYDFIPLGKNQLCVVIGDVSDKGLPAALFMALTFSLIRAETGRTRDPIQVMANVNQYLRNMNALGMFVTLIFGILDLRSGIFDYCRAGHLLPILVDREGACINVMWQEGQPLGLFSEVKIDHHTCEIPKGGMILLYSDGLNEAVDGTGSQFGMKHLRENLLQYREETAQQICEHLWEAVQAHCGEQLHQDDFTTVLIKRK